MDSWALDLALVRTAKLLGMHIYVQRLLDDCWAYVKNNVPKYVEMSMRGGLALDGNDSFFGYLVGRLTHLGLSKKLEDDEEIKRALEGRQMLGRAVEEATKGLMDRKRARNSG
jgi:hypothetical protein